MKKNRFTMESVFLFYLITVSWVFLTVLPTSVTADPLPTTSYGDNITIRGKQYTAIGYNYADVLHEGQEFQTCEFDPATGYLYVIDNNNSDQGEGIGTIDQILTIDPANGMIVNSFNLPTDGTHSWCLTLGDTGNLFFAERGHSDIYELDKETGGVLEEHEFSSDPPPDWPGIQRDDLAYNPNADMYYKTENSLSSAYREDSGRFMVLETFETIPDGCLAPRGITYETNNDSLLIIDDSSDKIYEYGLDGILISSDSTPTVDMPEDITHANGVAFDPETGRIFVSGTRARAPQPIHSKILILTPVVPVVPGDLTGNGATDRGDLMNVFSFIGHPVTECAECDIDGDGSITIKDARRLVLMCTLPRCSAVDCFSFEQPVSNLNAKITFYTLSENLSFKYFPGPLHSTDVSFDLWLNNEFIGNVPYVSPGSSSAAIPLPNEYLVPGENVIELKDPVCPNGIGSCVGGVIVSWAGKACILP